MYIYYIYLLILISFGPWLQAYPTHYQQYNHLYQGNHTGDIYSANNSQGLLISSTSGTNNLPFQTLQERMPPVVDKAEEQAMLLLCLMEAPNYAIAQRLNGGVGVASPWTNPNKLESQGYAVSFPSTQPRFLKVQDGRTDLENGHLRILGINPDKNILIKCDHTCPDGPLLNLQGNEIHPTYASFTNVVNIEDGVIISDINTDPKAATDRGVGEDPTIAEENWPDLRMWADVVYLSWAKQSGVTVAAKPEKRANSKLNHCIRTHIMAYKTSQPVREALKSKGEEDYPDFGTRITFSRHNKDELQAFERILGSPHGSGCAHFATRYKHVFDIKIISQVTVWAPKRSPLYHTHRFTLDFQYEDAGQYDFLHPGVY